MSIYGINEDCVGFKTVVYFLFFFYFKLLGIILQAEYLSSHSQNHENFMKNEIPQTFVTTTFNKNDHPTSNFRTLLQFFL